MTGVTNPSQFGRRPSALPSVPKGDILGTYDTYLEAQQVVDTLAKADFEVSKLSIVGNDLKTVERVTGKRTYGRSAIAGAASGAYLGLFLGILFVLFSPESGIGVIAAAAIIGVGFGMLFSIVSYALNRRRRDFTSTHQVLATNYTIVVDPELTAKAQALLS
jgi:hypothetical protein